MALKKGGGNRVFIEIIKVLHERGHDVEVLYPAGTCQYPLPYGLPQDLVRAGVGIHSSHVWARGINLLLLRLFVLFRRRSARVLISDPIQSILFLPLGRESITRFVQADDYRLYDDLLHFKRREVVLAYKVLCHQAYRYRIAFLFNSEFVYQRYAEIARPLAAPPRFVFPGFNPQVFYPARNAMPSIRGFRIGTVGRKQPWKGLVDFLDMARMIRAERPELACEFLVISNEDLSAFDLAGCSLVVPRTDDEIANAYRSLDAFVSTSWWEGFGLPQIESMACGVPLVTTRSGGVESFAHDGTSAIMTKPRDAVALATAIIALATMPERRLEIALEGIRVTGGFTWEAAATSLFEALEAPLNEGELA